MRWELSGVYVCRLTYGAHVHISNWGAIAAHSSLSNRCRLLGLCERVVEGCKLCVRRIKLPGIITGLEGAMLLICPNGPWLRFGSKPDTSTLKIEKLHRPVSGKGKKCEGNSGKCQRHWKNERPRSYSPRLIHQRRTSFSSCILCGCVKWHHRSMCRAVSFIELLCNVLSVCSAALHVWLFGRSLLEQIGFNECSRLLENCILD